MHRLAAAPRDLSQAQIEAIVNSAIDQFAARPPQALSLPVMRLPEQIVRAIKAETPIAVLSGESLAKNMAAHPDIRLDEYRLLPRLGASPTVAIAETDKTVLVVGRMGRLYTAVIKRTATGKAIFVTSFRRTNEDDVARMLRSGRIVYGRWEE